MIQPKLLLVLILSMGLTLSGCSLTTGSANSTPTQTATTLSSEPITAPLEDVNDVRSVLNQSADAMLKVESYEYVATDLSKLGGSEVSSTTTATVFPILGDGWIQTTQNGVINSTYLKNNRMYMVDPRNQSWVFVDMPKSSTNASSTINPKVKDYMTLTKTDKGYLIRSIRPLSALEFYMLSGIEGKEMQNLADMVNQGVSLDTVVEMELDQDFRYKKVTYDQVTTTGGVSTQNFQVYEYSNYNTAAPVVIPEEILTSALPLDTGSAVPTDPGNTTP